MRIVPLPFPCGCVCRGGLPEYGAGVVATLGCAAHLALHRSPTAVEIDNSSIAGCDCPGCEFGRYCRLRERPENYEVDNWRFLARLKMRRVRAIVARDKR